jgi:hypothetical protein
MSFVKGKNVKRKVQITWLDTNEIEVVTMTISEVLQYIRESGRKAEFVWE